MRTASKNSHRDFLRSQALSRRRKQQRILRLTLLAILAVLVVTGSVALFWIKGLQVDQVVITGNVSVPTADILSDVQQTLGGRYIFLFPKTNSFIYPKQALIKSILTKYPLIQRVTLTKEGLNTLNVIIQERGEAARWCPTVASSSCYLLDSLGYIYAGATSSISDLVPSTLPDGSATTTDSSIVIYGTDQTGIATSTDPIGSYAFSKTMFQGLMNVAATIASSSKGMIVSSIDYVNGDEIRFRIEGSGDIIFSSRKAFGDSLDNLFSALQADPLATSTYFNYIDVRYGDKVFYKLGNPAPLAGSAGLDQSSGSSGSSVQSGSESGAASLSTSATSTRSTSSSSVATSKKALKSASSSKSTTASGTVKSQAVKAR